MVRSQHAKIVGPRVFVYEKTFEIVKCETLKKMYNQRLDYNILLSCLSQINNIAE